MNQETQQALDAKQALITLADFTGMSVGSIMQRLTISNISKKDKFNDLLWKKLNNALFVANLHHRQNGGYEEPRPKQGR